MATVKWIKIVTDIFDDEKMLLIESLPGADSLIVIWFKLLCLAGKNNNDGVFLMNNRIPYTDEMLATIFRREVQTVRLALKTFEEFGMIEVVEGVITIPNWDKHQTLDAYEKKKERDRIYQQERRAKQKMIVKKSSDTSSDTSADCSPDVVALDIDIEKDIDKEIEEEIIVDSSLHSESMSSDNDYEKIKRMWNTLDGLGDIKGIKALTDKRKMAIRARLKEYSLENFEEAIENIRHSDFLQGKHNGRPFVITFDWFIRPNNFPKVLEGNYTPKRQESSGDVVDMWQKAFEESEARHSDQG